MCTYQGGVMCSVESRFDRSCPETDERRSATLLRAVKVGRGGFMICRLVACLTSQQHASASQGWVCSDNFTCCHT